MIIQDNAKGIVNALINFKGNLTIAKNHVNSNKTIAMHYFSNAYSDVNVMRSIYYSSMKQDDEADKFIDHVQDYFSFVNEYIQEFEEDDAHYQQYKDMISVADEFEEYLIAFIKI